MLRCLHIHFCGDPKRLSLLKTVAMSMFQENQQRWFPMRIRNSSISRLEKLKERLDNHQDIDETYAPLGFIRVNQKKMDFAPFLVNFIFVRSTFAKLVAVKSNLELFEPLRFIKHPVYDDKFERHEEVLYISDKQMEDYMRVTAEANEKVIFLDNLSYACKPSREVQITEGQFTGVIGRIKRIGGTRCVVLPIGREIAPAIIDVPNKFLRYLTEEESRKIQEQAKAEREHNKITNN